MIETLLSSKLPPGLYHNGTKYMAKGRYYLASLVRFFEGMIMPVGGWARQQDSTGAANLGVLTGIPRMAHVWSRDDGTPIFAWGTTNRLQIVAGATLFDISPGGIAATNVAAFPPATVVVSAGSLATSGATAGNATSIQIAATTCSGTYNMGDMLLIAGVLYTVTAATTIAANTALVPVSPAAPGGGIAGATAVVYYATIKRDTTIGAAGGTYGNSTYGTGAYGVGATGANETPADTWQCDVYGEQGAYVCTVDKVLYVNTGTAAATVASGAPSCRAVVITPERYVTTLFAQGVARRVMWADRESTSSWTPSSNNTAGNFDLKTEGQLVCGRRGKNETLLWTDTDMHAMTYIGGVLVYSFNQRGDHCGIIGPNAVTVLDTNAFWMGTGGFYLYDGTVQRLPCDVWDYVWQNLNYAQRRKVWSMANAQYGEVWWFYPSGQNTECDSYVVFNYVENHWNLGTLGRTAGWSAGPWTYPVMADSTGAIYEHERGNLRTGGNVFLESGPFEMGNGDQIAHLQRIVPDCSFTGTIPTATYDVNLTIYSAFYPTPSPTNAGVTEVTNGPYTLAQPTNVRVAGRQFRVRYTEVNAVGWREGDTRLGWMPGGRR